MKNFLNKEKIEILINNFNSKNYTFVISKTKNYIKKYPNTIFLYNILGSSYQNLGKQNEAIETYKKALKIKLNDIHILNNLANSYKYLLKYKKAETIFNEIIRLNPKYTNAYINLGNLKRDVNNFKEAINLYEKANTIAPNNFITLYLLALAHQGIGNFETAVSFAKKVLTLNPKFTKADYLISQSIKYSNNNWHYRDLLKKKNDKNLKNEEKINLYFSLAKANEDFNKIKESSEFLKLGCSLAKETNKYDINKDKKLFKNIKTIFKDVDIQSFQDSEPCKIIFILGMPRSGTSLLEQILSSHDNIVGGGEMPVVQYLIKNNFLENDLIKDNIFEDSKKFSIEKLNFVNQFMEYIEYFNVGKSYIVDKSLLNFLWIGFIKIFFPNSKIIHCLREPKNNCFSIYKNLFENNLNFSYDEKDLIEFYKMYQDLMKFWQNDKKIQLINVTYETLINNPENEIRRIIKECNLNWDEKCLFHYNNKSPIKTMSTSQARKPIYNTSLNSFDKYKMFFEKIKDSF